MLRTLFALVALFKVLLCKDFFISKIGSDDIQCGTASNKQCKTFHYLFNNVIAKLSFLEDLPVNVFVDGGIETPFEYNMQTTISLNIPALNMKKNPVSKFRPVIQPEKPFKPITAFQSSNISFIESEMTLDSILFRNMSIWECNATSCNLTIRNCTIDSYDSRKSQTIPAVSISVDSAVSINAENSFFAGRSAFSVEVKENATGSISVISSEFRGSAIQLHSANPHQPGSVMVNVHKTKINAMTKSFLDIKANVKAILINESKFEDNHLGKGMNLISFSQMHNSSSIHFSDVTITRNTFAGILTLMMSTQAIFQSVDIKHNTLNEVMLTFDQCTDIRFVNLAVTDNIAHGDLMKFNSTSYVTFSNASFERNNVTGDVISFISGQNIEFRRNDFKYNFISGSCFDIEGTSDVNISNLQFIHNVVRLNFFHVDRSIEIALEGISLDQNSGTGYWNGFESRTVTFSNMRFSSNNFHEYLFSTKNGTNYTSRIEERINSNHLDGNVLTNLSETNSTLPAATTVSLFYKISNLHFHKTEASRGFHFMMYNSIIENVIFEQCQFYRDVISFQDSENVVLRNIEIVQSTSTGHIIRADFSKNVTFQNMTLLKNQLKDSVIYVQNCTTHTINSLRVIKNTMDDTALSIWFTELNLHGVYISGNEYHTGISITNSDAFVSELHIDDNLSRGSTKEFYYTEYYDFDKNTPKRNDFHCFYYLKKRLTLTNVIIKTSMDEPRYKKFYAVSFFLIVPKIIMENVTIDMRKHQTAALEMYVNIRKPEHIQPDIRVLCPAGATPQEGRDTSFELTYKYQVYCQPCPQNFYTTERGMIFINNITKGNMWLFNRNNSIIQSMVVDERFQPVCQRCSVGGVCRNGLSVSRGNFYGYITQRWDNNSSVMIPSVIYRPCPTHYCCSSRDNVPCIKMNTCMPGRQGKLCGKCMSGYQENFFNTSCIKTENCQKQIEFWVVFIVTVFIIFFVICFLDLVGPAIKAVIVLFKKLLKLMVKRKKKKKYYVNKKSNVQNVDDVESGKGNGHKNLSYIPDASNDDEHQQPKNIEDTTSGTGTKNPQPEPSSPEQVSNCTSWALQRYLSTASENCLLPSEENKVDHPEEELKKNQQSTEETDQTTKSSKDNQQNLSNKNDDQNNNNNNKNKKRISITPEDDEKKFTVGGVFQAFVSFYQVRSLIHVDSVRKFSFSEVMGDIFNGGVFFNFAAKFCPYLNLGVVDKIFVRYVVFFLMMLLMLVILVTVYTIYQKLKANVQKKDTTESLSNSLSFKHRLEVCYSRIFLFNFKNLAFFCVISLNCVTINDANVLFINGTSQCFQNWQYTAMAFLVIWVIPFPFALAASFHLYQHNLITYHEMMACLTFPLATLYYYITRRMLKFEVNGVKPNEYQFEFVLKMYVEPYRLIQGETDKYVFWEHWRLIQRLILSFLSVYFVNPLYKVTVMVPCIVVFAIVYIKIRPFNKQFTLLHWLEVTSLLGYFFIIVLNLFKGFLYVHNITDTTGIELIIKIFTFAEIIFSPLVVIVVFMTINFLYEFVNKKKVE